MKNKQKQIIKEKVGLETYYPPTTVPTRAQPKIKKARPTMVVRLGSMEFLQIQYLGKYSIFFGLFFGNENQ